MKISQSLQGFKLSRLADGYSPATLTGYLSSLGILADYLDDPELTAIQPGDLKRFMLHLRTEYHPVRKSGDAAPLMTASYHRYWKAIRCFFKWAAEDLDLLRPDLDLKMPKYTNREIVPFSEQEIQQILAGCYHKAVTIKAKGQPYRCRRPIAQRDRALVLFLLDTGLRAGELCRLRVKDVQMDTGEVQVFPYRVGKTRPRLVYLGKQSRKALWKYLADWQDTDIDDPLFLNDEDGQLTVRALEGTLKMIETTSQVTDCHPHCFRHTFAIMYLHRGGDVFTLKRFLGHATLAVVLRYVAIAECVTASAHRKASPVDGLRL